jgi:hypothetical protein
MMMNYINATALHQEVVKFLYFLQTLAPVQLSSLWQFVQIGQDNERWTPNQLITIVEKATPAQLEQLMILTSAEEYLREVPPSAKQETRRQLEVLSRELSTPIQQLENSFRSLFQLFQLQDLLQTFSFVQLMKFFEVIPSGSQMQQIKLISQLQQLFGQLTPETLENLHNEVQGAQAEVEMHLLSHTLHLQPEHFHLYQPIRLLLHMEHNELRSFQDALPKLQPIQMLQLLQLLQLPNGIYDVIELKKVFHLNQSPNSIVEYVFMQPPIDRNPLLTTHPHLANSPYIVPPFSFYFTTHSHFISLHFASFHMSFCSFYSFHPYSFSSSLFHATFPCLRSIAHIVFLFPCISCCPVRHVSPSLFNPPFEFET